MEAPAQPARPTFWRLLWAVLLGYVGAFLTLGILALGFAELGLLPQPFRRPGPFVVTGAWSLDADLVVAVAIVLVAAWWIRMMVVDETEAPVSFGVVALVVAATGFAPFLALRPVALTGFVALPLTTWLVRRYAVDRVLPLPRPSWRVSAGQLARTRRSKRFRQRLDVPPRHRLDHVFRAGPDVNPAVRGLAGRVPRVAT